MGSCFEYTMYIRKVRALIFYSKIHIKLLKVNILNKNRTGARSKKFLIKKCCRMDKIISNKL